MKTLILIRHAKSDWPENTDDFDRPLANNGLDDAIKMSKHLKNSNITIEKFVSSPAVRALNTCKIFNQVYDLDIKTDQKLYNPTENNFYSIINGLEDEVSSVAMFSHNNGISNFANILTENLVHFPTCGVAGFEAECQTWAEFENADKKLLFFCEPKKI